jgi:hypothetical protein
MTTPKPLLLTLFLLLAHATAFSQPPAWLDYASRKSTYSDSQYFTGFGQLKVNKNEDPDEKLNKAKEDARTEASQSAEVTIQSKTILIVEEKDRNIANEFKQSMVTFSDVKLMGLKVESWFDKKTKTAFAFAYVEKQALAEAYRKQLALHTSQLESKMDEASKLFSSDQKMKALDVYTSCLPLINEMEEDLVMVMVSGGDVSGKLPGNYQSEINMAIAEIQQNSIGNPDDLCMLLASSLKKQLGDSPQTIRLFPFTYQDTKIASELSARLLNIMEQKLSGQGLSVSTVQANNNNYLLLSGTYWEEGDFLKFSVVVKDPADGKTLASAENRLPGKWPEANNLSYKPENLEEALQRKKVMSKDEIIGGGLLLDVWTNKGDENILFFEDEKMKLSVRVNHECYLRFIYYLADGTKTLLHDDYFINNDQVNKLVTLPNASVCSPPFGAETLQVAAQTEKFQPLQLKESDGYMFILDDTEAIVSNVRGFKKESDQQLFAEKSLTITTIKK